MDMNDDNYKQREVKIHIDNLTEKDDCDECGEKRKIVCCDKCANSVCTSYKCSLLFPHRNGSIYTICNSCRTEIEHRLKMVVDLDKLKLLKKKIKKRLQKNK